MWPRDAYVGQRVVCINTDALSWYNSNMDGLTVGKIYTVRRVGIDPTHSTLSIWLNEIVRPVRKTDKSEVGYHVRRFKPVDESRLDIFREMLNNAHDKNLERQDA